MTKTLKKIQIIPSIDDFLEEGCGQESAGRFTVS